VRTDCADISVIICAYTLDRWSDLVAAVGSVREQTLAPSRLIAVIPQPSTPPQRVAARMQEE
jgi:hypothetical protein